ncbi:MAG: 50S ribosomal protein L21 [Clostridia bacterium]|nr:50S ribosomal protein L21 [Clostridia bacterium]
MSGKQYKVTVGETLEVDRLQAEVGEVKEFPVLLTAEENTVVTGNPVVKDVVVKAKVVAHTKGSKIVVFKYKAKKNERKKQGHRQAYTKIVIESIG